MLSFQGDVWSQHYECTCAIGEFIILCLPTFSNPSQLAAVSFDNLIVGRGFTPSRILLKLCLAAWSTCWSSSFYLKYSWGTESITRISASLISRLMLNLRDPEVTDPTRSITQPLSHANMVFVIQSTVTTISTSTRMVSAALPWLIGGICYFIWW